MSIQWYNSVDKRKSENNVYPYERSHVRIARMICPCMNQYTFELSYVQRLVRIGDETNIKEEGWNFTRRFLISEAQGWVTCKSPTENNITFKITARGVFENSGCQSVMIHSHVVWSQNQEAPVISLPVSGVPKRNPVVFELELGSNFSKDDGIFWVIQASREIAEVLWRLKLMTFASNSVMKFCFNWLKRSEVKFPFKSETQWKLWQRVKVFVDHGQWMQSWEMSKWVRGNCEARVARSQEEEDAVKARRAHLTHIIGVRRRRQP